MKKVLLVFGTRPEAIKMAPLVKAFERESGFITKVCVTAQHREMLDQVLDVFNIQPDFDLNIMRKSQDLFDVSSGVLQGMKRVLSNFKPNIILVHGDTTTSSITALASFYQKIPVGHVEAGLRTYNIYNPWPEEANRQITGILAKYHFAPTDKSFDNLINENKSKENILVTGNTVIDALLMTLDKIENNLVVKNKVVANISGEYELNASRKFILVTGHRRENFGEGLIHICNALKSIASTNPDIDIVYPVHLNPNVQKPVNEILHNISNIYLIKPLAYESFVYLMKKSYFIITDSGGIQEEAPSLGKPVLVTRDTTERPEALEAGTVKLVGTEIENIVNEGQKLINNKLFYDEMSKAKNPYGNGTASQLIVEFIREKLLLVNN